MCARSLHPTGHQGVPRGWAGMREEEEVEEESEDEEEIEE